MTMKALGYAVGHAINSATLTWRHHGIGCLQAYLHEGQDETRVHIWHPALVIPGFDITNGLAHSHRFAFQSYVLLGEIWNEEITLTVDPTGKWVLHNVTPARDAMREEGTYNKPLGVANDELYSATRDGQWYRAGERYEFELRKFHLSLTKELAVTLVVKGELDDEPAQILARRGTPLIHAFEGAKSAAEYVHIIAEASLRLTL